MNYGIAALPRSRTMWFSMYFSAMGSKCLHEPFGYAYDTKHAQQLLDSAEGVSDSTLAVLPQLAPKYVIIHRDPHEVFRSLVREFDAQASMLDLLYNMAQQLRSLRGLHVCYEEINSRLQEIHEYCIDTPYDMQMATQMKNTKVTIRELACTEWYEDLIKRNT